MKRKETENCIKCGRPCVQKIEFLQGLPENTQEKALEGAVHEHYEAGTVLFRQGDPVRSLLLIHSGKIRLRTLDAEGREHIVGIFSDGEVLWEGVLIPDSRYPYDVLCEEETVLCRIPVEAFEKAMEDPLISRRVIGLLSRKLHDANERSRLLATADPKARLAGFLLEQSTRSASDLLTLKLEEIASSIHLRPETVSRKVRELEREEVLERIGQSGIRLKRPQELKKVFEAG